MGVLKDNNLGPDGGKAFGDLLAVNKTLTNLNVIYNSLGDAGGIAISEALKAKKPGVEKLDVSRNYFGEQAGKAFAAMIRVNKHLSYLNLRHNPAMGPKFGEYLAGALKVNAVLKKLNIWD